MNTQVKTQISAINRVVKFLIRSGLLAIAALSVTARADVSLPRLLSDGMVLQRDRPVTIWGWADEGEQVTVQLGHQTRTTRTRHQHWQVTFGALKAGQTCQISIQGKNRITLHDVQVGEVWIAAGQSNMELTLGSVVARYPDLIQHTSLPAVREFSVPTLYSFKGPQEDFPQGQWKTATPDNLAGFSAVGFFYARELAESLHIPVGIISLAVGGSPAQAWMSEPALSAYPHYLAEYKKFTSDSYLQATIADDHARLAAWYAKTNSEDQGLQEQPHWSSSAVSTQQWQTLTIPGPFNEQHVDFSDGVIWLRKTVTLTQAQAQLPAVLLLGAVVDADEVFINDEPVGQTTYRYLPRAYPVGRGVLHAGDNTVAIRLTSYSSDPGFVKDKPYGLQLGDHIVSLEGAWRYKVGMRSTPLPQTTTLQYQSHTLFNAELAPTLRTGIRGVIWYQGESNTGEAKEYAALFPALIQDWRAHFKQGNFPFLYVQLANFMEARAEPSESDWAQLRQAQRDTLRVDNTGMAVAIDLGEWNDIHPLNKKEVGERLALLAKKMVYDQKNLVASGPLATGVTLHAVPDSTPSARGLLVHFFASSSPLVIKGAALSEIAIAGADHHFHWAKARILHDALLVWSEQVPKPRTVRYAWADNPALANLTNGAGLPASPFELSLDPVNKK